VMWRKTKMAMMGKRWIVDVSVRVGGEEVFPRSFAGGGKAAG
jgi:hypothetical protein